MLNRYDITTQTYYNLQCVDLRRVWHVHVLLQALIRHPRSYGIVISILSSIIHVSSYLHVLIVLSEHEPIIYVVSSTSQLLTNLTHFSPHRLASISAPRHAPPLCVIVGIQPYTYILQPPYPQHTRPNHQCTIKLDICYHLIHKPNLLFTFCMKSSLDPLLVITIM